MPPLSIFANPPRGIVGCLSKNVYEIILDVGYGTGPERGKIHTLKFKSGEVHAYAEKNGTVVLPFWGAWGLTDYRGNFVRAIRYQHAEDGKNYEHQFEKGAVFVVAPHNAKQMTIKRRDGRPVWADL